MALTFSEPLAVSGLQASQISTSTIRVSWDVNSDSYQDVFRVTRILTDVSEGSGTTVEVTDNGSLDYSVLLEDVSAGRRYTIEVQAVSNDVVSETMEITLDTSEQLVPSLPPLSMT